MAKHRVQQIRGQETPKDKSDDEWEHTWGENANDRSGGSTVTDADGYIKGSYNWEGKNVLGDRRKAQGQE